MIFGLIYKAISPSGRCYIGQTINLKNRINQHKNNAFNEHSKEFNHKFHKAIRKYGFYNIIWEILVDEVPICLLDDLEIEYIKQFNSFNDGYNLTLGGNAINRNLKFSDTHRKNLSFSHRGLISRNERKKPFY